MQDGGLRALGAGVVIALALGSSGCGGAAADGPPLRRLGSGERWTDCLIRGESRPAAPCVQGRLVASGSDTLVPETASLDVPLAGGGDEPALVVVQAYTYAEPPTSEATRGALANLASIVGVPRGDRELERIFAHDPAFHAAPQPRAEVVPRVPATVTLRFPTAERGRRALFGVWAWPVAAAPLTLAAVTPGADDRLTFAFGVQDAGWEVAPAPVTFTVSASPADGAGEEVLWQRTLEPAWLETDRGWQEDEIDLASWAERSLRLVLAAHAEGSGQTAGFASWARPALASASAARRAPPSILLVSIDTLRADHLGAYGSARKTTPSLDRLAASGVLFERAVAHFPSTTASHMTMLTSLEPCAHGVLAPGAVLGDEVATVTQQLAARGYATVAITEDALIRGDIGFNRGFDSYRDMVGTQTEPLGQLAEGLARARSWLGRHGTQPFFMFLHTYQVHVPYKIPDRYRGLFPVDADAPEARRQEADYDAGLCYADEQLGGFLRFLEESGILERALVVVTSDHGTEFGEHGGIGHARGVYEEQLRVPLVFHHPTLAAGGRRVAQQVGLIDLAPTLLEVAGAERPASFAGRSLLALVRGGGPEASRDLFSEQLWGPRQTLLRSERWAWIEKTGGLELYDLEADPHEQHDLAAADPARAADGAKRIAEFRAACQREHLALRSGTAHRPLEPARSDALRALGYVQ